MERLQKSQPEKVHLLTFQYRCHPSISLYPSKEFYGGRLVNDDSVVQRDDWITQSLPFLHTNQSVGPITFFDVLNGREERIQDETSTFNRAEASVVQSICIVLGELVDYAARNRNNCKGKTLRVGVISPYKKQVQTITNGFQCMRNYFELTAVDGERCFEYKMVSRNAPKMLVDINTVDAFQGRERDVVIISCVRANGRNGGVGFLDDVRRINVAITRAKYSLLVVGHRKTLETGSWHWNRFIDHASVCAPIIPVRGDAVDTKRIFKTIFPRGELSSRERGGLNHRHGAPNHRHGAPNYRQGAPNHRQGAPNHRQGNPNHRQGNPNHRQGNPNHRQGNPNHRQGNPNHRQGDSNHRPSRSETARRGNARRRANWRRRRAEKRKREQEQVAQGQRRDPGRGRGR